MTLLLVWWHYVLIQVYEYFLKLMKAILCLKHEEADKLKVLHSKKIFIKQNETVHITLHSYSDDNS